MEHSPPWEADIRWVGEEIPWVLWNPKIRGRVHKNPSLRRLLSLVNPLLSPHAHFCLPNDLLPSDLPTNWWVRSVYIYLPLRSVCPTHLLDLIAVTVFDEEYSTREASHYIVLFSEAMNCTAGARFLESSLGLSFYFQFPLKQIWCSIFFRCRGGRLGLMTALFCL
jgi:hypothetical protein